MSSTEVIARPVDTPADEDDEGIHVFCPHVERTWCGDDANKHEVVSRPPSIDQVCRVCLLAVEFWVAGDPCPMCGCRACLQTR
ncbi:hypothetical protein [Longimicrobium sp.]|jgi:hypothetical protein|uniref:hypothetical protein n=1 Tax=Longimicrobium sp. TaxID=2029185 RepID=UPI002ED80B03